MFANDISDTDAIASHVVNNASGHTNNAQPPDGDDDAMFRSYNRVPKCSRLYFISYSMVVLYSVFSCASLFYYHNSYCISILISSLASAPCRFHVTSVCEHF